MEAEVKYFKKEVKFSIVHMHSVIVNSKLSTASA